MEIRTVSDSVTIYSDGKRLQVIHDLGDEFVLDFGYRTENVVNIDELSPGIVGSIVPVFKVSGFALKVERVCTAYAGLSSNSKYLRTTSRTIRLICLIGIKIQEGRWQLMKLKSVMSRH